MEGWIKLHRAILNKAIWKNSTPEQKVILITLLLMANHTGNEWEFKGDKFKCNPGQFITSLENILNQCGTGISIQNVRTALKRFEKYEFLTNESTKQNRLITICNWSTYQSNENDTNKAVNNQLTDNQQTANRQPTNSQQTVNSQLTTNKNDNNENNEKTDKKVKTERVNPLIPFELLNTDFIEKWETLIVQPKWKNKTSEALEQTLNRLKKYDVSFSIELIENAISGGYQGVTFSNTKTEFEKWKKINQQPGNGQPGKESKQEQNNRVARELISKIGNNE